MIEELPGFHICGLRRISRVFHVRRETVGRWIKAGAPIILVGRRYQTNYFALWEWLRNQEQYKKIA